MSNIINIGGLTKLPIPVQKVLQAALDLNLTSAIIIGYDQNGEEYFSSSEPDGAEILWLLERSKQRLIDIIE